MTDTIFKRLREEYNRNIKDMNERDLTPTAIAREMHLNRSHVTRLESGERPPTLQDYLYYHKKFNVTLEYLLGETKCKMLDNLRVGAEYGINDAVANTMLLIHNESSYGETHNLEAVLHAFIGNGLGTRNLMNRILYYLTEGHVSEASSENDALIITNLMAYINSFVKPQLQNLIDKIVEEREIYADVDVPSDYNEAFDQINTDTINNPTDNSIVNVTIQKGTNVNPSKNHPNKKGQQ